jgi:hypothetical protein
MATHCRCVHVRSSLEWHGLGLCTLRVRSPLTPGLSPFLPVIADNLVFARGGDQGSALLCVILWPFTRVFHRIGALNEVEKVTLHALAHLERIFLTPEPAEREEPPKVFVHVAEIKPHIAEKMRAAKSELVQERRRVLVHVAPDRCTGFRMRLGEQGGAVPECRVSTDVDVALLPVIFQVVGLAQNGGAVERASIVNSKEKGI